MSSTGKCLKGTLFMRVGDEWQKVCEVTSVEEITPKFTTSRDMLVAEQRITKKQAKKLLKYEKNPMARKELQRIISAKE